MSHIRIILADGNYIHLESLQQQWQNELDLHVVNTATSGVSLLGLIARIKPDIVVMDLALREMDGLEVLKRLNLGGFKPMVAVYSAMLDQTVINECARYGVDYFVCKPAESAVLAKRIRMLCSPEQFRRYGVFEGDSDTLQMRTKVTQLLNFIGMPNKLSGYRYLRRAILHALQAPKALDDLAGGLYVAIASEEGTTSVNVERSMRYAIEFVFMYGSLDALQELFGFTINSNKGKPSNREFIAMLSDHLSLSIAVNV
jgi:two-component system, response regulator, stage 0 sporulation protein A